jgi:hypothetical protein
MGNWRAIVKLKKFVWDEVKFLGWVMVAGALPCKYT